MVRAELRGGGVRLIDPLPVSWSEGEKLVVESDGHDTDAADPEAIAMWLRKLEAMETPLEDPGEWDAFQARLAAAAAEAREQCRSRSVEQA